MIPDNILRYNPHYFLFVYWLETDRIKFTGVQSVLNTGNASNENAYRLSNHLIRLSSIERYDTIGLSSHIKGCLHTVLHANLCDWLLQKKEKIY